MFHLKVENIQLKHHLHYPFVDFLRQVDLSNCAGVCGIRWRPDDPADLSGHGVSLLHAQHHGSSVHVADCSRSAVNNVQVPDDGFGDQWSGADKVLINYMQINYQIV